MEEEKPVKRRKKISKSRHDIRAHKKIMRKKRKGPYLIK